jgi:hypothetical protein
VLEVRGTLARYPECSRQEPLSRHGDSHYSLATGPQNWANMGHLPPPLIPSPLAHLSEALFGQAWPLVLTSGDMTLGSGSELQALVKTSTRKEHSGQGSLAP